jgi:glucose/arabinose dehydrogenase
MKKRFWMTMLLVLAGSGVGVGQEALGENDTPEGKTLYEEHCARCHGKNLEGGEAPSLIDGVWLYGTGRSQRIRNVRFGILQQGMPAFDEALSDEQIDAISDFVGQMEKSSGSERPPLLEVLDTYDYDIRVERFAEGLDIPWAIEFLDNQTALITERTGALRVVRGGQLAVEPVVGTPEVLSQGQGGLMDVAKDPNYADNGWIYLSYSHVLASEDRRPPAMTRLVRGKLQGNEWVDQEVIYEAPHETYLPTRHHYGCRIVFDPQGHLYFSIGDRGRSQFAQDLKRPNGKTHRIWPDGRVPKDNPFVGTADALGSIFSYGHRNPQGLAVHPDDGSVWNTEHGPMGGDEVNLIQAGLNYGWPEITYGKNYNGTIVTEFEQKPGMAQPVLFWRPSIAACGLDYYQGDLFPKWKGWLLAGALAFEELRLLSIEDQKVIHQEIILKNAGRVRDVTSGPDGAIYVVLNNPGTVIRLTPIVEEGF